MLKRRDQKNHVFFKNGWKTSQKMRLDALIILLIEDTKCHIRGVSNRNTEATLMCQA